MKSRRLGVILVVLLLGLAGCLRDAETVKKRYLANGDKYLSQGKFKEAAIMYRNAIKRDPKFGEAYFKLGEAELRRGDPVSALRAYRRAVELLPNKEEPAGKLADIYLAAYTQGDRKSSRLLDEVGSLSKQLLDKDPKSFNGQRLKGLLAVAKEDFPAALEAFRGADQARPKVPEVRFAIAQVLARMNDWEMAEKAAQQLAIDHPSFAPVYDFLVVEYLRRDMRDKAEAILSRKVAGNPKVVDYRIQQAGYYRATGRQPEMEKILQELLSKESEDPSVRMKVGDFYVLTRQWDSAVKVFQDGAAKYGSERTKYRMRVAQVTLAQGKPKDAITVVDQALADDPKNSDALSMRASLQLQYGGKEQQDGAIKDLQSLIGKEPNNVVIRFNLARAYQSRGEYDAAKVQYSEAIRLSKSPFLAAHIGSGQVALAKRDFGRALQDADAVLKVDPRNTAARVIKTNALINSGNLRQARADLTKFLADAPDSPDLEYQLAITNFIEGKYKEAEAQFRGLRQRFPSDSRLLFAISEVMVRTGKVQEALAFLQGELGKNPKDRNLRVATANTAYKANQLDSAEKLYRELLAEYPKDFEMYLRLGEALRKKGQMQASVEVLRKGQQMAPSNAAVNLQLAMTLEAAGMKREALPLYENIMKIDPENVLALNNLAYQYAELGKDLDMALTYAQKAKQKAPNSDDVTDTLGWVYVKKNLHDNAITVFKGLVAKQPKNPLYHYHLGYAYMQKGKRVEARQSLQTALSLRPGKEDEASIRELLGKLG